MTDKRPTLSLKPKAKAATAGPARSAAKPGQGRGAGGQGLRASHEVKAPTQLDYRPALPGDSLACALLGAAASLARVRAGTALPQALADTFAAYAATPQARGAIQDIAYRSMRQLGRSETLLGLMTTKAPEPAMLASLLCAALTLLDPPAGSAAAYDVFTVVDQAVGAAAAHPDFAHAKAMVNAVLRRFLREREALVAQALRAARGAVELPAMVDRRDPHRLPARLAGDPGRRQPPAAADLARQPPQDRARRLSGDPAMRPAWPPARSARRPCAWRKRYR